MNKGVWVWVRDIAIAVAIAIIISQFIRPTIVKEHSMEETLLPNDYIFLSKQAYTIGGEPQRGDIVVFHSSLETNAQDGTTKNLIKRVIATEGETVSIHDGKVYIDGAALDEPYTRDNITDGNMSEITVPKDELFLLGDNRQQSLDSRSPSVGFISKDKLIGKAVFRLFPITSFGPIG